MSKALETNTATAYDVAFKSSLTTVMRDVLDANEREALLTFMKLSRASNEGKFLPNTDLREDLYDLLRSLFEANTANQVTAITKGFIANRAAHYKAKIIKLKVLLDDIIESDNQSTQY